MAAAAQRAALQCLAAGSSSAHAKGAIVQVDDLGAIETVRAALALAIERAEADGTLKELERMLEARLFEVRQLLARPPR
jgi:hypothetical protein